MSASAADSINLGARFWSPYASQKGIEIMGMKGIFREPDEINQFAKRYWGDEQQFMAIYQLRIMVSTPIQPLIAHSRLR